jgi:lactoylglutathione lyase
MGDTWLCDTGIRVNDLERSIKFYTSLLDLIELKRASDDDSAYVLFKDRRSGQRLELNWYSERSPFYTPYVAGDGLDHLEVRVRDVAKLVARLKSDGIEPVNRKLWVNERAVKLMRANPEEAKSLETELWVTATGHTIAYISDPDGNLICLYDHPEEDFDGPIPEHY